MSSSANVRAEYQRRLAGGKAISRNDVAELVKTPKEPSASEAPQARVREIPRRPVRRPRFYDSLNFKIFVVAVIASGACYYYYFYVLQ